MAAPTFVTTPTVCNSSIITRLQRRPGELYEVRANIPGFAVQIVGLLISYSTEFAPVVHKKNKWGQLPVLAPTDKNVFHRIFITTCVYE